MIDSLGLRIAEQGNDQWSVRSFNVSSTSAKSAPTSPSTLRASSAQSSTLIDLLRLAQLEKNWDGEGAPAPDFQSLVAAVQFLNAVGYEGWEPGLHADGRVVLEREGLHGYSEVVFSSLQSVSYLLNDHMGQRFGADPVSTVTKLFA